MKQLVKQLIMACPKCGTPDAKCACHQKPQIMTKGKAADIAVYFEIGKLLEWP